VWRRHRKAIRTLAAPGSLVAQNFRHLPLCGPHARWHPPPRQRGHLSPYRDTEEIALAFHLPLGLDDARYPETTLQLAPGDTLTFLSDGVVEARNAQGELYGFDRTRAISGESAEQIARAAQHFGQEDDITVLTLTFAGAEVLQV
jgi:serine/threonine protein phosphatase PrpC